MLLFLRGNINVLLCDLPGTCNKRCMGSRHSLDPGIECGENSNKFSIAVTKSLRLSNVKEKRFIQLMVFITFPGK